MYVIRYTVGTPNGPRSHYGNKPYDTKEEANARAERAVTRGPNQHDKDCTPPVKAEIFELVPIALHRRQKP